MRPLLLAGAVAMIPAVAGAVPPLVSGDVPTAEKGHVEAYGGVAYTGAKDGVERHLPSDEVVVGVSDWQELTLELPYLFLSPSDQAGARGPGDLVLGTKVMLLRETAQRPGMALSLEAKLPTASRARGLGSGATDYDLLWRTQKSWGRLTAYSNLGWTFIGRPAGGAPANDTWFASLAGSVRAAKSTTLLSEVYLETNPTPGEPSTLAGSVGVTQNLGSGLALRAAVGKSLRQGNEGGPNLRVYAGLSFEFALAP